MLEKTLESPLDCKKIKLVNPKGNQSWIFIERNDWWRSNTLTTWWKEVTHWKRSWSWEILRARGEGDEKEWDDWMASLIQWTWVWASSGSWWWTKKPGMLQSRGLQKVTDDWETELEWIWTALAISARDQLSGYEEDPWSQGFSAVYLSHSPISWSLWTQEDTPRQPLNIQIKPLGKVIANLIRWVSPLWLLEPNSPYLLVINPCLVWGCGDCFMGPH